MNNYYVSTSLKETRAQPGCTYLVCGVSSESEAIEQLYKSVQEGLLPFRELGKFSIPDYTCGFKQ